MEKPLVLCRCGHQVMGKEVLRTDLYERSSGQEYVYVKFRCARCKRIAQTFVPARQWDWKKLEPLPGELSSEERDRLLEAEPVAAMDLLHFHDDMAHIETASQLADALHLEELAPAAFEAVEAAAEPARPRRRRTRGRRERAKAAKARHEKSRHEPERPGEASHEASHEASDGPHQPAS